MKLKFFAIFFILCIGIISPAAAFTIQLPDWINNLVSTPNLELHSAPGGTVTAGPGESILFNLRYYNEYPSHQYFQTEIWEMPCGAVDGFYIGKTGSTSVMPGTSGYDQISLIAPTQAGTYQYSLISYHGSSSPPQDFDDEKCVTVIVSAPSPPPSPTWPTGPSPTWPEPDTPTPSNQPPIVDVVKTQNGNTFNYDGSGSTDPDGTITSYVWTVDGINNGNGQTFTVDGEQLSEGSHSVQLVITDNEGATAEYLHHITITKEEGGTVRVLSGHEITPSSTTPPPGTGPHGESGLFSFNIGGQPYTIPGFDGIFGIIGILSVYLMIKRKH